jgi:hypothetical protein
MNGIDQIGSGCVSCAVTVDEVNVDTALAD